MADVNPFAQRAYIERFAQHGFEREAISTQVGRVATNALHRLVSDWQNVDSLNLLHADHGEIERRIAGVHQLLEQTIFTNPRFGHSL